MQVREKVRRKKIQAREMLGKSPNALFSPMICGLGGSKSRLAKAAGAEPCGQRSNEKLRAALARSAFSSQHDKHLAVSDHFFGSWDVEKLHAAVARSAFASQNAKN